MDSARFDRQILLFGAEGQARIERTSVAIVGLGGTGSHVAQQLAYLGVRSFHLIDRDQVSKSNLNRLVGASMQDVRAKRLKVEVIKRQILRLTPDADVQAVPKSFISEEGYSHLRQADFIFGCMDRDAPRLILTEFCAAYDKRYLDIATDVDQNQNSAMNAHGIRPVPFGGRVLYSAQGERCLICKDVLDQEAIRREFSTEAQKQEEERIYGVPRAVLQDRGPSVVSLNGILASVAVTEFMVEITGIRPAIGHLEYHGLTGKLTVDNDPPQPDCYYCKSVRGRGDAHDLLHYVRDGWGEQL